jgi:hypothetical protein
MKAIPEGIFDTTPRSREGEELESPSGPPDAELLAAAQSVSLYIPKTNQYVNIDDNNGWAVIQYQPITTYAIVPYSAGRYYIVVTNGSYDTWYLSYNNADYVGAYRGWNNACWWSDDPVDCLAYPGLYPYESNGTYYLCVDGVKVAPSKVVTVVAK